MDAFSETVSDRRQVIDNMLCMRSLLLVTVSDCRQVNKQSTVYEIVAFSDGF